MSRGLRLPSVNALAGTNAKVHSDPITFTLAGIDRVVARPDSAIMARGSLRDRGMNKTEAEYERMLRQRQQLGAVLWYDFEAITLKLADDTRYTPDFAVLVADGIMEMHETKGFMRDDAFVKLKLAARLFPFRFYLIRKRPKKSGGGWDSTEV